MREQNTPDRTSILLVTRKTSTRVLPWADLATSVQEAMDLWKEKRHNTVFADFGDLGDGMTGARLASMLRKEGQDIVIYLLSDRVQPHQLAWAQRNGANDVIARTAEAIAACLPNGVPQPKAAEFPSGFPADESPAAVLKVVDARLQKYARLGPARSVVLQDALQDLLAERSGQTPTAYELAQRVAGEIASDSERAAFLNSFSGAK